MHTRRAILRGTALAGTAGAVGALAEFVRPGSISDPTADPEPSLTIQTLPADEDVRATTIAQRLADTLGRVGIHTSVVLKSREELFRDVLAGGDFDLYVARHPGYHDPDGLRSLLASSFADARGWQNPFGYRDGDVDAALARQRRTPSPEARQSAVETVQRAVVRDQPFTPVAMPLRLYAIRSDRYVGWWQVPEGRSLRYLGLERRTAAGTGVTDAEGSVDPGHLRLVTTDDRITRSLNPLSPTGPRERGLLSLVYDPLGRRFRHPERDVEPRPVRPWLASSWEWQERDADGGPVAEVALREDATWHDGQPVTAEDVALTYRLLADVSLGRAERALPAARFGGRASLVSGVEPVDERRVRVSFRPASGTVAERAFTVPVLPAHVWRELAVDGGQSGGDAPGEPTPVLAWPNTSDPVGSGPLRVASVQPESEVTLRRFDDHFLAAGDDPTGRPAFDSGPAFDRLTLSLAPADETAVELVVDGAADAVASPVGPDVVPSVGESPAATLQVRRTRAFYHVGYNCRREPLADPSFRRAVARLVDEAAVVEEVFHGYGRPVVSPLAGTSWVPETLQWEDGDPGIPFAGEDGTLDVDAARAAFTDAGAEVTDGGGLRLP